VGTEVQVKYSIFLSKVYKGLYPHTQAKKKHTSHPDVEDSPRVPLLSVEQGPRWSVHLFEAFSMKPLRGASGSSGLVQMLQAGCY